MNRSVQVIALFFLPFLLANTMLSSIPKVRAQEDTWTTLASMPTPRNGLGATSVNGKIYAIGGSSNLNEVYNPTTNTWTTKVPPSTGRVQLEVVAVQNKIYAIGGYQGRQVTSSVNEEYDPVTNTWITKSPMPRVLERASLPINSLFQTVCSIWFI